MHRRDSLIFPTVALVFLAALLSLASFVHAESVMWNTVENGWWCGLGNNVGDGTPYWERCISYVHQPNITVTQNVRVVGLHADGTPSGEIYACGSSVPVGTSFRFEFVPFTPQDVYWFGTGGAMDSPYGTWGDPSIPPAQTCQAGDFVGSYNLGAAIDQYVSVIATNPTRTVSTNGACIGSGETATCTNAAAGTITAAFSWTPFTGKVYHQYYRHDSYLSNGPGCYPSTDQMQFIPESPAATQAITGGSGAVLPSASGIKPGTLGGVPYTLQIPTQQLLCPLTIIAGTGNPPATPTLSSAGLCTVGSPHAINMTSTDPDNDNLKYGIDWDASGSVDQWIPGSGYVASGSTQTASRTYAIPGSKTVKALAQDMNGNTSSWASISFSCSGSATAGLNEGDGDGEGGGGSGDGDPLALLPDLDLRVIPSLVKSGNTTKVNWSSDNVQSCSVSGENGDSWSGLLSPLGGLTSKPITSETTYTLSCIDLSGGTLTKTATVRIIPTFQEL